MNTELHNLCRTWCLSNDFSQDESPSCENQLASFHSRSFIAYLALMNDGAVRIIGAYGEYLNISAVNQIQKNIDLLSIPAQVFDSNFGKIAIQYNMLRDNIFSKHPGFKKVLLLDEHQIAETYWIAVECVLVSTDNKQELYKLEVYIWRFQPFISQDHQKRLIDSVKEWMVIFTKTSS